MPDLPLSIRSQMMLNSLPVELIELVKEGKTTAGSVSVGTKNKTQQENTVILVFCLKTGILKIGVLVGKCCFLLKTTPRKLHSTLSAIYHLVLHTSISFFLSVTAEGIMSGLFTPLSRVFVQRRTWMLFLFCKIILPAFYWLQSLNISSVIFLGRKNLTWVHFDLVKKRANGIGKAC